MVVMGKLEGGPGLWDFPDEAKSMGKKGWCGECYPSRFWNLLGRVGPAWITKNTPPMAALVSSQVKSDCLEAVLYCNEELASRVTRLVYRFAGVVRRVGFFSEGLEAARVGLEKRARTVTGKGKQMFCPMEWRNESLRKEELSARSTPKCGR